MTEFDFPIHLTFHSHKESYEFVTGLEQAQEQVIWEQRVQNDGTVAVTILNIISLEEKAESEDQDG